MANIYDMIDTWTDGSTLTAIKMNVADDSSAADSKLLDLQVDSASKLTVGKDGAITAVQAGSVIPFYYDSQGLFPSASTYHGALAHSHNDGAMYFAHGGNWLELINANTSGNVGIGTASPTSGKLQIETTAEAGLFVKDTGDTAAPYVRVQGQRGDANRLSSFSGGLALEAYRSDDKIPNDKHLGTIYFGGNHTNGTEANISYTASISGVSDGAFNSVADMPTAIAFHTGDSGTALGTPNLTFGTERMRISSSGNVGIGTSSPSKTLDVNGDAKINSVTVGRGSGNLGTNTAIGFEALYSNTTGINCVAIGSSALKYNDSGSNNTAIGRRAARELISGNSNCAFGMDALRDATTGGNNVAIGTAALKLITVGTFNTAVGHAAGETITTGNRNIYIGRSATVSANDVNDEIVIGYNITGQGADTAFIGGTNGAYNEANNLSWSTTSDQRIKKNIVDNNNGLDLLTQVQVRNFEYRTPEEITELPANASVNKKGVQLGVIAQELQTVIPNCVTETSAGVLTVSTDNLIWYLINAVKELKAEIDTLKGN